MKAFSLKTFTPGWMVLLSLLMLTGCGSDSNPINPTSAQVTQVNSVNSQVPQNIFSSTLTGSEEIPGVASSGSGTGVVSVDPATNQMRATIVTADINGSEAHIHIGATGIAGPVVFALTENEPGSGVWTTTATLTADQLSQLTAGNYYFNVHTAAHPDGEIRGQILAQLPPSGSAINITSSSGTSATGTDTSAAASGSSSTGATATSDSTNGIPISTTAKRPLFYVNVLSGALVIPPNGSVASGTGIVAYRPNNRTLTAVVITRDISGIGANIRQAAAGATGPVIGSFTETSPGSGIWVLRATLTAPQAEALINSAMYYEIVSSAFPGGELRGQIVSTQGAKAQATPAVPSTTAETTSPTTPAISNVTTITPTTTTTTTTTPSTTTPTTTTTPIPTTNTQSIPGTTTTTPSTSNNGIAPSSATTTASPNTPLTLPTIAPAATATPADMNTTSRSTYTSPPSVASQ